MSFIIKQGDEPRGFDPAFVPVAERLGQLQKDYDEAKNSALTTRMEMIGISEEQKKLYPQRSEVATYINQGYRANDWGESTISRSYTAYTFRQELLDKGVEIFTDLAEASTPTQLYELAMADKARTTTVFNAAQHLSKTGKVPSKSQIIGHKQGNTNDKFKFFSTIRSENKRLSAQQEQDEFCTGARLDDTQSSDVQPLRNSIPLENNTVRTAGKSPDGVEVVGSDQVEVLNKEQITDLDKDQDQLVNVTEISTDPNSEPTEGLSSSSLEDFVSSLSAGDLYKVVEKFTLTNYKSIRQSPQDQAHIERIVKLFQSYLHIHC